MSKYFDGELLSGYEDKQMLIDKSDLDFIHKQYQQQISDLEAKLAESEEQVKHWHDLYNDRDKQFQSVRQRYHLLNKLQSNYDKKDKLHLVYMQCAELVDENEKLKQQLAEKEKENLTLFSMLYETLEKQGCENITSSIEQMTNLTLEKQSNWFKENCVKNQDKISFAVEQLEKVKDYFCEEDIDGDGVKTGDWTITKDASEVAEYLDNLIEELKKELGSEQSSQKTETASKV